MCAPLAIGFTNRFTRSFMPTLFGDEMTLTADRTTEVTNAVKKTIADQFGYLVDQLRGDMTYDELLADDLDEIELVMALEDEFGFEISDDDQLAISRMTVDETVAYVHKRIAGA
jgi:acyl carrier protein